MELDEPLAMCPVSLQSDVIDLAGGDPMDEDVPMDEGANIASDARDDVRIEEGLINVQESKDADSFALDPTDNDPSFEVEFTAAVDIPSDFQELFTEDTPDDTVDMQDHASDHVFDDPKDLQTDDSITDAAKDTIDGGEIDAVDRDDTTVEKQPLLLDAVDRDDTTTQEQQDDEDESDKEAEKESENDDTKGTSGDEDDNYDDEEEEDESSDEDIPLSSLAATTTKQPPKASKQASKKSSSKPKTKVFRFTAVPKTARCGTCPTCLNPHWKKACLERRKEMELQQHSQSFEEPTKTSNASSSDTKNQAPKKSPVSSAPLRAIGATKQQRDSEEEDQKYIVQVLRNITVDGAIVQPKFVKDFLELMRNTSRIKTWSHRLVLLKVLNKSSLDCQKVFLVHKGLITIQHWLEKAIGEKNTSYVNRTFETLNALPVTLNSLKPPCEIGKVIGKLKKEPGFETIHGAAKSLIAKWKAIASQSSTAATSGGGVSSSGNTIATTPRLHDAGGGGSTALNSSAAAPLASAAGTGPPSTTKALQSAVSTVTASKLPSLRPPEPKASTLAAAKKELDDNNDMFSKADKQRAEAKNIEKPQTVPSTTQTSQGGAGGGQTVMRASIARVSASPLDALPMNNSNGGTSHAGMDGPLAPGSSSLRATAQSLSAVGPSSSTLSSSYLGSTLSYQPLAAPVFKTAAQRAEEAAARVPDPEPVARKEGKKKVKWVEDPTLEAVRWFWQHDPPIAAQRDADETPAAVQTELAAPAPPTTAAADGKNPKTLNPNSTAVDMFANAAKKEHLFEAETLRLFKQQENEERSEVEQRMAAMNPTVGWYDPPTISAVHDIGLGIGSGEESLEATERLRRRSSASEVQYFSMDSVPMCPAEPPPSEFGYDRLAMPLARIPLSLEEAAALATAAAGSGSGGGGCGHAGGGSGQLPPQQYGQHTVAGKGYETAPGPLSNITPGISDALAQLAASGMHFQNLGGGATHGSTLKRKHRDGGHVGGGGGGGKHQRSSMAPTAMLAQQQQQQRQQQKAVPAVPALPRHLQPMLGLHRPAHQQQQQPSAPKHPVISMGGGGGGNGVKRGRAKTVPCRFFNSPSGCQKGDECPFLHIFISNHRAA